MRPSTGTDNLAGLVRAIVAKAGVVSPVLLRPDRKGDVAFGCVVYPYRDGAAQYAGILFDYGLPDRFLVERRLTLAFDKKAHLYEVRSKRYVGHTRSARLTMKPGDARLYAAMPYRIESISAAPPETTAAGRRVAVKVSLSKDGQGPFCRHVARVDVFSPSGKHMRRYSGNAELADGAGAWSFRTALNDQTGRWKVRVSEVVSGVVSERVFEVVAPK